MPTFSWVCLVGYLGGVHISHLLSSACTGCLLDCQHGGIPNEDCSACKCNKVGLQHGGLLNIYCIRRTSVSLSTEEQRSCRRLTNNTHRQCLGRLRRYNTLVHVVSLVSSCLSGRSEFLVGCEV